MCMPPAGSMPQMQNMSAKPADRRSAQAFMNMAAITDPSYVRSVYDKGGSEGFQQRFGPYDGGRQNPFGGGAYRALAKQQGREFNPADLFSKSLEESNVMFCMELMDHAWLSGRSSIAPHIQLVDDNGLTTFLFQLLGINCYHI